MFLNPRMQQKLDLAIEQREEDRIRQIRTRRGCWSGLGGMGNQLQWIASGDLQFWAAFVSAFHFDIF